MTRLYIRVHPDSDSFQIETGGRFPEVYLRSAASGGRANRELRKRLEDVLGVRPGIVSGHHAQRKEITVDLPEDEIMERLAAV